MFNELTCNWLIEELFPLRNTIIVGKLIIVRKKNNHANAFVAIRKRLAPSPSYFAI